jgi:tRNA threonylcarbamoyladenosine biosynthesis protein TsaB
MGEVYWAAFRSDGSGGVEAVTAESVSSPDRVPFDVAALRHAAGNGIARHPTLRRRLEVARLQIHDGLYPRADAIARIGARELAAGRWVAAEMALPVYVRDDVARPSGGAVTGVS